MTQAIALSRIIEHMGIPPHSFIFIPIQIGFNSFLARLLLLTWPVYTEYRTGLEMGMKSDKVLCAKSLAWHHLL